MTSITTARFVLLLFAAAQALLVWSLRFLPRPIKNRMIAGIVLIGMTVVFMSIVFGELSEYVAATGHVPLKNDNLFLVIFLAQQIVAAIITFNSDSVLQAKERESGGDNPSNLKGRPARPHGS